MRQRGGRATNGKASTAMETNQPNPNAKRRPLDEPVHLSALQLADGVVSIGGQGYIQVPRGDWAASTSARAKEFLERKTAEHQ